MGFGIIALGLWLLLGIQYFHNQISFFPEVVSLMMIAIGVCIVLKKTKSKYFIITLILLGIEILLKILAIHYTSILLLILLYFVFLGIEKLGSSYQKIKQYKNLYKTYLLCLLIMKILSFLMIGTQETWIASIGLFIQFISIVLLCIIEYHILKMNAFLKGEYIDLKAVPLNNSNNKRRGILLLILSCISIGSIVYIKDDYEEQIKQEINLETSQYFKVDKEEYKVVPFGYTQNNKTALSMQEQVVRYSAIRLFINNDLVENLTKVKYIITRDDQIILEKNDLFIKIVYTDEGIYYGHNPFPEYTGGYVLNDTYHNIDALRLNVHDDDKLMFKLMLFNEAGECFYSDESEIERIIPKVYSYEDEDILIQNMYYDMNSLVGIPQIKFKIKDPNITRVIIYYPDAYPNEDPLLLFYNKEENNEFELDTFRDLINEPIEEFTTLKIVYYGLGSTIIKTTVCELTPSTLK